MKNANVTQSRCHTVTRNMKKPNETQKRKTQNAKLKCRADAVTRCRALKNHVISLPS